MYAWFCSWFCKAEFLCYAGEPHWLGWMVAAFMTVFILVAVITIIVVGDRVSNMY